MGHVLIRVLGDTEVNGREIVALMVLKTFQWMVSSSVKMNDSHIDFKFAEG